jgi:hypothetical protein
VSTVSTADASLPYLTRTYDTNDDNTCASVAAAIFFAYYYDHIDTSYVLAGNVTANGRVLTDILISYIEPRHDIIDGTFTLQVSIVTDGQVYE